MHFLRVFLPQFFSVWFYVSRSFFDSMFFPCFFSLFLCFVMFFRIYASQCFLGSTFLNVFLLVSSLFSLPLSWEDEMDTNRIEYDKLTFREWERESFSILCFFFWQKQRSRGRNLEIRNSPNHFEESKTERNGAKRRVIGRTRCSRGMLKCSIVCLAVMCDFITQSV